MFQLFKKKTNVLFAPIDGYTVPLESVKDPVFSQKMLGDGIAIQATGDVAYAPADGIITVTIESKHAFGMALDNGLDLIVHVGLDTVDLQGAGFEMLVEEKQRVTAGTPIIRINRELMEDKNIDLITPVIITNPEVFEFVNVHIGEQVKAKESPLIEYR